MGLTLNDGAQADARSEQFDTLDAAMTDVETEGRAEIDSNAERPWPRVRETGAAEALIRPFLRRHAAAELRLVYDERASRALFDWQSGLGDE